MKLIKQLTLLFVVIALSAGAYAVMFMDGTEAVNTSSAWDISLPWVAVLFGTVLVALGNLKRGVEGS